MSDQIPTPPPPSFGDRLALAFVAFIRALVRIMLILLLAVLLGAGIYYGVPALYRRYVQPVETNLARLNDAQSRQEQADQQINRRLDELGQRLEDLELQNDTHKQVLDELQASLEEMERIQQSTEQAGGSRLNEVKATLAAVGATLEQLQGEIADMNQAMGQTSLQVRELVAQAEVGKAPLQELRNELQLIKAMEHLTRSRVYLVEDNLGLAQQDVRAARLLLANLGGDVPAYQVEALTAIIARLDAALSNLPSRPVLAAEDLEVAWQLLRNGLPSEATPQPTPTGGTGTPAALIATGTPTPTPIP